MIDSVSKVGLTSQITSAGNALMDGIEGTAKAVPAVASGISFADMLGSMATQTMDSVKNAETMSFKGIQGTANTREVVDAVMQAEQSLQTAIAIRDKVVSAYLDLTKMQM